VSGAGAGNVLTNVAAWIRRRWPAIFVILRVALHAVAILSLLGTLLLTIPAEAFFNRGVTVVDAYHPIPHTQVNPLGINTFLNEEPDPAVVERSLDMIAGAGYGYVRQIFGWYEIELRPGVYVDAEGRSTWEKYDRIVRLASERGLQIIARLEKPPPWARAGQPNPHIDGPPDRLSDYANFVEQVVARYRGQITYVQIWNEPNLQGEWGALPIDPRGYVDLLEVGYRAAKRANPDVVVLLAGLAPTDQTGPDNLSDLLFLERVYEYGGAPFFDIATVMVYGYGYSPWDRRVSFGRNNFSRPVQTREIMERFGDVDTPIWAVEYGWVSLPDDWQGRPSPWGEPVSRERQAQYLVDGYKRAQREWPWMGVMAVWAFRFPQPPDAPEQIENPTRGFAIVEHDFTPIPAWQAIAEAAPYLQRDHPGSYALTPDEQQHLANGGTIDRRIAGHGLKVVVQGRGELRVTWDGEPLEPIAFDIDTPQEVTVARNVRHLRHDVSIAVSGESPQVIGYVVTRPWFHAWAYPSIRAILALALLANVASAAWTWREVRGFLRYRGSNAAPLTDNESADAPEGTPDHGP
jgi:polysaccharide biosynthesis protein PslG